ncbi:Fe-Mn family superoxide dismutase [Halocella sp. SP3-1]|uniref:superoxide dismutase n=1 Tax=Halocella sp. SP3-1 TaxID=2382161 RepID=UPI00197AD1C6|nr:Fe-Mn family superoxide dismutase [Halocella sp. SP3-1]
MAVEPKIFNFDDVKGISENQLNQHYQLYLGYINSLENIMTTLSTEEQTNYEYRGLKEGETYSLDGIVLHELYFANLAQTNVNPARELIWLINRDFGNYRNWLNDFMRTARVARGWAVLAYDYRDESLHNIMQDAHNVGVVWHAWPLLVLDVYEHAYMIDFGINKERYLEVFKQNIDWSIVNKRFYSLSPIGL